MGTERNEWQGPPRGYLAAPGSYTVSLSKRVDGAVTELAGPVSFEVRRLREGALDGAEPAEVAAFWQRLAVTERAATAANRALSDAVDRVEILSEALERSTAAPGELDDDLHLLEQELYDLDRRLSGHRSKQAVGEPEVDSIRRRVSRAASGTSQSTYGPTPNLVRTLEIAEAQLAELRGRLNEILTTELPALEARLVDAGAPWTPGQPVPPVQ
jgi:hypothetical protein